MTKRVLALAASVAAGLSFEAVASHVSETMTLSQGWNAIYLESTPTNATCADFFAGSPVVRVGSYHSDAYSATRQLAEDGTEVVQKPVSYTVWVEDDADASTMDTLIGGRAYLVYATNSWEKTFLGVPSAPQMTWRVASADSGFMNLAGVSVAPDASVTPKAYFGEGPFGTAGTAYKIYGPDSSAPKFQSMKLFNSKLAGGQAYALTATEEE